VNLEGRIQRLRRVVFPPAPDELAAIAKLAERFGVETSPYASSAFEELSALMYDGLPFAAIGEQAPLPERRVSDEEVALPKRERVPRAAGLRLVTYRPLFSGPAVERIPELQFQRPDAVLELSPADARPRQIESGDAVVVRSNGTSARLRASVSRKLAKGTVRAAEEHVRGLTHDVEVAKA
jgi:predicted molibdopterin-dependent oxidoreductase YjgC